ncbi:MAG: DUF1003 domain-containing protein [Sphingomonadales bacterium]|nr:DUF1003 domain-containing protein [Sphingomonadales bacterium]MDE2569969.1 DUF1003 domain-containing protein [Sphingomonadales bacterium]
MAHHKRPAEQLAGELLGRSFSDLGPEEQRVLERIASGTLIGMDADELAAVNASAGDRLADRVAAIGGSWAFIIAFAVVLLVWVLLNSNLGAAFGIAWDRYPYIFLNLMLSMLAAIQAPVIMMSQNRQSAKDRVAARHDYEVNLRTQLEILRINRKIDRLAAKLGHIEEDIENGAGASAK